MLIVGLTGSIGMGKSTAAARFRALGVPVFDADAEVHRLYAGEAAREIERAFPGTTAAGLVDRRKLAAALIADESGYKRLEAIVHPLVRQSQRKFLHDARDRGEQIAVVEIPLLYETGADQLVDTVVVVSASREAQRDRVLARPGMTAEKLDSLLARQLPDAEKRRRAEFLVDSSGTIAASEALVDAIVAMLRTREGTAFERFWN